MNHEQQQYNKNKSKNNKNTPTDAGIWNPFSRDYHQNTSEKLLRSIVDIWY